VFEKQLAATAARHEDIAVTVDTREGHELAAT
jgi:hypothetical protein